MPHNELERHQRRPVQLLLGVPVATAVAFAAAVMAASAVTYTLLASCLTLLAFVVWRAVVDDEFGLSDVELERRRFSWLAEQSRVRAGHAAGRPRTSAPLPQFSATVDDAGIAVQLLLLRHTFTEGGRWQHDIVERHAFSGDAYDEAGDALVQLQHRAERMEREIWDRHERVMLEEQSEHAMLLEQQELAALDAPADLPPMFTRDELERGAQVTSRGLRGF